MVGRLESHAEPAHLHGVVLLDGVQQAPDAVPVGVGEDAVVVHDEGGALKSRRTVKSRKAAMIK